ncbi:MAG: ABC transporter ATP-binding protein/permease [Bacteroidales bacterium]|nr:ABC transporter ATP-binding protein/permease [Bacteroidales bacterium]MCF8328265.1 ABC transporter ATP-binding protein/permease [Bacteroidales bacterium]
MHRNVSLLQEFLHNFYSFLRLRGLVKVLSVNSLQGITQGIGIVFIIPLLQLINPGNDPDNKIALAINNAFSSAGIPLTIYTIVIVYIVLVSFTVILRQYQTVLSSSIIQGYTSHLREQVFNKISSAQWAFLQTKKRSFFIHALTQDINKVSMTTFNLLKLVSAALIILFNIVVAFLINFWFTLITIVFASLLALFSQPLLAKAKSTGIRSRGFHQSIYNSVVEMLNGLKNIKSHNLENEVQESFRNVSRGMVQNVVAFAKTQAFTKGLHGIISVIVLGLYFLVSIQLFSIPTASLLVLIVVFSRLVPKFTGLVSSWQNVLNALPAFEGTEQLLDETAQHAEEEKNGEKDSLPLTEGISLKKVSYDYKDSFSLENISLYIPAGSIVALAGSSGSGKTTTADLITGLLRPQQGRISVDNIPLQGKNIAAWRNSLSYVTQESYFFNDTIRNNLLFGIHRKITDEEIWQTLEACTIAETIKNTEAGLDTIMGDQGTRLSGGERQRLAIARAILRQPALLILDEATSALDYASENMLYKLIYRLKGKMTIIIIAHRLSTIQSVDKIFVLAHGKLAEQGTWNELSQKYDGHLKFLMEQGSLL